MGEEGVIKLAPTISCGIYVLISRARGEREQGRERCPRGTCFLGIIVFRKVHIFLKEKKDLYKQSDKLETKKEEEEEEGSK